MTRMQTVGSRVVFKVTPPADNATVMGNPVKIKIDKVLGPLWCDSCSFSRQQTPGLLYPFVPKLSWPSWEIHCCHFGCASFGVEKQDHTWYGCSSCWWNLSTNEFGTLLIDLEIGFLTCISNRNHLHLGSSEQQIKRFYALIFTKNDYFKWEGMHLFLVSV